MIKSRITQWAQDVLEAKPKQNVPEEWQDYVNTLFAALTKEELTAKLLAIEMAQIQDRKNDRDLNTKFQSGGGGRKGRGRGGSRRKKYGRSGGKKNNRGKNSYGGKKSHRKGGRNKQRK